MIGERMQKVRQEKGLSLSDLSQLVQKSPSTLSRYEKNQIVKLDTETVDAIANALTTSTAYLMGLTDDTNLLFDIDNEYFNTEDNLSTILITDEEMSPELPYGALVKIRPVNEDEKLQVGSFYYIEFENKKCFRMAVNDKMNGLVFLPNDMSERRIAYDCDYVNVIGKAVSMNVVFEDEVEYV